uniref:DDE Tnp4 domain-containing protein n=1 Tax=Phytophthora ramorum TaxID=164328 RepID=H3GVH3_PHYRM
MAAGDSDAVLLLTEAFLSHDEALREVRRDVYNLLVEDAWKVAIRSRHYLTTQCLDVPCDAAWIVLYRFGKDINFLNTTSLTRPAFEQLLRQFNSYYYIPPPESRGRPPKLRCHHQILGLVLYFYVGSMEQSTLCLVFGVPCRGFSEMLRSHCRVRWRQPSNADLQNAMYNGWLHTVLVTGTICFAADGCIVWCRHNCPGSWNDSDTYLGFRNKLLDPVYCPDKRMNVVSDSAFPCSAVMAGRILTPLKDGDLERIRPSLRSSARTLHNAITSVRQAVEWGMGSMQKVYSRLKLPLPYDPELRGRRINNSFRMANYRVRTVGILQIRTTFAGDAELT